MDPIILTPRLKFTLITSAERGSEELGWLHELRSNEKSTWWSIYGRSKTIEDTERIVQGILPTKPEEEKAYRVAYAVHEILPPPTGNNQDQNQKPKSKFIGLVKLSSITKSSLPLPESLTLPASAAATTLTVELAYEFLPESWGRGFATEALDTVYDACIRCKDFWAPYEKVYVRAIVNDENPASLRVLEKVGMTNKGVYEWNGKAVWLAGKWTEKSKLHIFGKFVVG